jgi:hypothetical protein
MLGFNDHFTLKLPHLSTRRVDDGRKDNMGWSGWEEFRNLIPNDKTN